MPPVRRHRIGDQMPAVTHAGPDPNAIALCRDLVAEAPPVDCAILFGSRALGGWDDQSDLDIIVIHHARPVMTHRSRASLDSPSTSSDSSTTQAISPTKARTTGWWMG